MSKNIMKSHLNGLGFEIAHPNKLKTKTYTRDLMGKLTEHYALVISRLPFVFNTDDKGHNYFYFDKVKFKLYLYENKNYQRFIKEFEVSGGINDLKDAYEKIYKEALELEFKRFMDFRK